MLAYLIGTPDASAVACVAIVAACIVITSLIVKRRSRTDVHNEFVLAKLKQEHEDARLRFGLETQRAVEFKKIDQNLITSHAVENTGGDRV